MTQALAHLSRKSPRTGTIALVALVLCLASGCDSPGGGSLGRWAHRRVDRPMAPGFSPHNVYRGGEALPADVRRVALLPLTTARGDQGFPEGRAALEPILERELGRPLAFEVVTVSREQLRIWTGRSDWHAEDILPQDLLPKIRDRYGCQAVVFAELTRFDPYGPIRIGWRFKLVDARKTEVYWAADELFDGGVPSVASAARRYAQDYQEQGSPVSSSETILSSPSRFGEYSLNALFATLPGH
jgi:hypothetical protein